ncbi:MAG: hypothetical protein JNK00_09665 [Flavipsychrobacter sp.]|nr:hypothetical protein [Flavipsychrobacter sp.]
MKLILFILFVCMLVSSCNNVANFPIAPPDATATDDRIIGKWQFNEDTNANNYYEVYSGYESNTYHIRFWDRGGTNPTYESNLHFSDVNGIRFINIPYFEEIGFLQYGFLKILDTDKDFTKITAAVVGDENIERIKSQEKLNAHITKNMNNPRFYSDTIHFYKIQ